MTRHEALLRLVAAHAQDLETRALLENLAARHGEEPSADVDAADAERIERILSSRPPRAGDLRLSRQCSFRGRKPGDFFRDLARETTYLVERYCPEKSLVILGGRQKSAKTFIAGWLTMRAIAARRRVTFVEEEGAESILGGRLEPFFEGQAPGTFDAWLRIVHRKGLNLSDGKSVEDFITAQLLTEDGAEGFRPQLVVLDALYVLAGCKMKEQDEMARVFANIQRIIREIGCTVVLLHHARKWQGGGKPGELEDVDELLGTVLLGASADLVLLSTKLPAMKQEQGSIKIHLICPENGSRISEPFARRLVTFKNVAGVATVEDVEDVAEEPAAKGDKQDMQAEEAAEVLRGLLRRVEVGQRFSIHALFGQSGKKVHRTVVGLAAGLLADEGLIRLDGNAYVCLQHPDRSTVPTVQPPFPGTLPGAGLRNGPHRSGGEGGTGGKNGERWQTAESREGDAGPSPFLTGNDRSQDATAAPATRDGPSSSSSVPVCITCREEPQVPGQPWGVNCMQDVRKRMGVAPGAVLGNGGLP